MKRSELIFTFLLIPIDILMVLLAFILAYKFRFYYEIVPAIYFQPLNEYFRFVLYTLPLWPIGFAVNGLYSLEHRRTISELGKIIVAVSAVMALLMVWIFFSRTYFFSRLIIALTWIFAIITVMLGRILMRFLQRFLYHYNIGIHKVIILGHNSSTKLVIDTIKSRPGLGYRIIKLVDHDGIEKLGKIVDRNPCDEIIVADTNIPEKDIVPILEFCRLRGIGFKMTPNLFLVRHSHVSIETLASVPILEFSRTPLEGWGKIIKRVFDIIGSTLLVVILSPIMLIVAILVKITSKGPILFRQERVGLDKNFTFLKFRTMREGAHVEHERLMKKHGVMFKLKNDPRLTPIGKFLRRTSLDEIPQFFIVLKGDMSLIGPRPPMPEEVERYNNWQRRRLGVKPGITGLWQVSGRSDLSFEEWVKLDAYYIENWSLWLDFQILLRTLGVVLKGRGAY